MLRYVVRIASSFVYCCQSFVSETNFLSNFLALDSNCSQLHNMIPACILEGNLSFSFDMTEVV